MSSTAVEEIEIVRALEEDIIFGRLAPGARLTEDILLARFPVTRHFVRQALVNLERLGIVDRQRNKSALVRRLTTDQVEQIYAVRELLQRQAALLVPLPAAHSLIEKLSELHRQHGAYIESGYLRGVHEVNDQFHLTLFAACGNKYLLQTIELYMRYSLPVRAHSMSDKSLLNISHQQHGLMLKMLSGSDNWVLAQLCVDHLQPSKNKYLSLADEL